MAVGRPARAAGTPHAAWGEGPVHQHTVSATHAHAPERSLFARERGHELRARGLVPDQPRVVVVQGEGAPQGGPVALQPAACGSGHVTRGSAHGRMGMHAGWCVVWSRARARHRAGQLPFSRPPVAAGM